MPRPSNRLPTGRVVMLAGDDPWSRRVFHALDATVGVCQVFVEGPVPRSQFLRARARRLGARRVAGELAFRALVAPVLARRGAARSRALEQEAGFTDAPLPPDRVTRVPSVNDPAVPGLLAAAHPEVVVINGTRIIGKATLGATTAPFVNMHAGITPQYRGVHGGYWALWQGDPEHCGVTVHRVDAGIDTGAALARAVVQPTPADNFATLQMLQWSAGVPALVEAVRALLAGETVSAPVSDGPSRLWSHPTLVEYLTGLRRGVR